MSVRVQSAPRVPAIDAPQVQGVTTQFGFLSPPAFGNAIVYALATANETISLTEGTISLDTEVLIDSDAYSTSNGVVTVNEAGTYLIINHLACDSAAGTDTARTSGESFLHINNTLVTGCYTDGYIRRIAGVEEFSDCAFGIYELDANDTVEVRKLRINLSGSDARIVGNATTFITANTALSMVRLDESAATCILEGSGADASALTANNTDTDQDWTTQTRLDAGYSHTSGNSDITIENAGRYLVTYSNSWERISTQVRTGVYERLKIDGSTVPGSWSNNYIRGRPGGTAEDILRGNNSTAVLIETTSSNQVIKLTSAREAGSITNNRLPLKSRICIYELDAGVKSFNIGSASTESIGSTTAITLTYDNSAWIDTGFSLGSNQITVSDEGNYLFFTGVHGDTGAARVTPNQRFRVNGVDVIYGTGGDHDRGVSSMQMVSPGAGMVSSVGASQTIEARNQSLGANTSLPRVSLTGAFCGIKLDTL